MPRFPYISSIFLLMLALSVAVIAPNIAPYVAPQLVPSVADIEAELSNRLSAEVEISGSARLRFAPRPQLILTDVSIKQGDAKTDLLAIYVPRLVANLSPAQLAQQSIAVTAVTMIAADVNIEIADSAAGFITRTSGRARPDTVFLDSRFRLTGLNSRQPDKAVVVEKLSLEINAGAASSPLSVRGQMRQASGPPIVASLFLRDSGPQKELTLDVSLGIDEQFHFDGFINSRRDAWQINGEVEVNSAALIAQAAGNGFPLTIRPEAQAMRISGLVSGDATGVSAETMEVEILNTVFRSRLAVAWPQDNETRPTLSGRMSTGAVNLDLLNLVTPSAQKDIALPRIWQSFAPALDVDLRVEATRFELGGESGNDLVLAFGWRDKIIDIERFNIGLPFSSSLLLAGQFDLAKPQIGFAGNFSARSSDTVAALLWAGDRMGADFAPAIERIDEMRFQRAALVGDVLLNEAGLALNGLSARIGDDYLTADVAIASRQGPQVEAMLRMDRMDFVDWGLLEERTTMRDNETVSLWPQLNRLLAAYLKTPDEQRLIILDVTIAESFAGPQVIGPVVLKGEIDNQRLQLTELHLSNIAGAGLSASGQLNFDAAPYYGKLNVAVEDPQGGWMGDWAFSGFGPVGLMRALPLKLDTEIILTAPDAPDWPIVQIGGKGQIGELQTALTASTPSRTLSLSEAGSNVSLMLSGQANALAAAFALPQNYAAAESGSLELGLEAQSNDLSSLMGALRMAADSVSVSGTLRPSVGGARLEGVLEFALGDVLPLLDRRALGALTLNAVGKTQINATKDNIAFSALDMGLGAGRISGEGVLTLDDRLPRLNMTLAAADMDLSWALPRFGKNGWRDDDMQWSLLGLGNAEIALQASNLKLGAVLLDSLNGGVKLTDGVMEAPALSFATLEGTGTMNVQAEGGSLPPRFNIEAGYTAVNPAPLMQSAFGNPLVNAPVDGTLTLSGRGNSPRTMMGSLSGDMRYEIAPGFLSVFDAAGFSDAVTTPEFEGSASALAKKFEGNAPLAFARGLGLAELRQGRFEAATTDIIFASGLNEAELQTMLDMVDLQMDGAFSLYPLDRQRAVNWQLSGDIRAPKITLDASAFDVNAASAPTPTQLPAE